MRDLHRLLTARFQALGKARSGAVFFIEHGLSAADLGALFEVVKTSLSHHRLEQTWWDNCYLPLLVASTEVGYRYRGAGTDFWPTLECELGQEVTPQGRQRIRDLFEKASKRFRGVHPPSTAWAESFRLIAWPIAHALLPLEFHRPLASMLAGLRVSANVGDDVALYHGARAAASCPSARFATLLEDQTVVVALTRSVLSGQGCELSDEIVNRISSDLDADHVARRSVTAARQVQRAARVGPVRPLRQDAPIRGALQLRLVNDALLLEASFPALDSATSDRLRRSLRTRRFAPRLWGVSSPVWSDQLLSGLPFALKLAEAPGEQAALFPDLENARIDPQDLAILQRFELRWAPPHLFAVSAEGDVARQVRGTTISGLRRYWALLRGEDARPGVRTIGELGGLHCVELDPRNDAGARALAQLRYNVHVGVSVSFAGAPSLGSDGGAPTFVAGDSLWLVPQRLADGAAIKVEFAGRTEGVAATELLRLPVVRGEHQITVSSSTDARDYKFRGVAAPIPPNAPVRVELRSEERTIQALMGGRLSLAVDGAAAFSGLPLTVDLEADGSRFSATVMLSSIPESVSSSHPLMQALLGSDEVVRRRLATAKSATLRARVGHMAHAEWELERLVRPCWWETGAEPRLLSEGGPLRFGVVSAEDPARAPTEGADRSGTYLLAPIGLDQQDLSASAPFTTLCIAPNRAQLSVASVAGTTRPRLERRLRGIDPGMGLEDLGEAYLRWSLAETQHVLGELHRRQVVLRIEEWMTELCCGPNWAQAERESPQLSGWGLLEEVCRERSLGRVDDVRLTDDQYSTVLGFAIQEMRRSLPTLWSRVGPPSALEDNDYEALDKAFEHGYVQLSKRYRARGLEERAEELEEADPGHSSDEWDETLSLVRERSALPSLAELLLPSSSAGRFMALDVADMTVDDVANELARWAKSAPKAFAGDAPKRELLKAAYALWVAPELALSFDWRAALETLLAERTVARATRYLALRARAARWGRI